jgi:hypothetical protein
MDPMEIYYSRRALLKRLLGEIATAGVLGALLGDVTPFTGPFFSGLLPPEGGSLACRTR